MKKNILKPMAIGALALSIIATPVFAQGNDYTLTDYAHQEIHTGTDLNLVEGTFIHEGTFYDTRHNFSFRIPPLWEDKVTIFQHHSHTSFLLNETEDFLFTISVFDTSENADIYSALPENFEENFYTLAEVDNFVYALRVYELSSDSAIEPTYFEMMQAPVNGIQDLFHLAGQEPITTLPELIDSGTEYVTTVDDAILQPETINIDNVEMFHLATYARALGFDVTWHEQSQTVEIENADTLIYVNVGNLEFNHNGDTHTFNHAPVIYQDKVFVDASVLNMMH